MLRLTTDNPSGDMQQMMNYAFAKDRKVCLAYTDGEENIFLHEYIARLSIERGCNCPADAILNDGECMECDCYAAVLNAVAIQAAELRGRLKMIEDILGDTYDLDHITNLVVGVAKDNNVPGIGGADNA